MFGPLTQKWQGLFSRWSFPPSATQSLTGDASVCHRDLLHAKVHTLPLSCSPNRCTAPCQSTGLACRRTQERPPALAWGLTTLTKALHIICYLRSNWTWTWVLRCMLNLSLCHWARSLAHVLVSSTYYIFIGRGKKICAPKPSVMKILRPLKPESQLICLFPHVEVPIMGLCWVRGGVGNPTAMETLPWIIILQVI